MIGGYAVGSQLFVFKFQQMSVNRSFATILFYLLLLLLLLLYYYCYDDDDDYYCCHFSST